MFAVLHTERVSVYFVLHVCFRSSLQSNNKWNCSSGIMRISNLSVIYLLCGWTTVGEGNISDVGINSYHATCLQNPLRCVWGNRTISAINEIDIKQKGVYCTGLLATFVICTLWRSITRDSAWGNFKNNNLCIWYLQFSLVEIHFVFLRLMTEIRWSLLFIARVELLTRYSAYRPALMLFTAILMRHAVA
jgi:hypothetical protein